MRILLFGFSLLCLTLFQRQTFADGDDWHLQATDSCAQFLTGIPAIGGQRKEKEKLDSALRSNPATAKLLSDLNASIGENENSSGYAVLVLINFCNSHAMTKLGDVTSKDILNEPVSDATFELLKKLFGIDFKAAFKAEAQKANPGDDQWETWLKQSLDFCGTKERCKAIAYRSFANHLQCAKGNRSACDQYAQDVSDWKAVQTNGAASEPHTSPQENPQTAMMKCLQDTAMMTIQSCNASRCPEDQLIGIIGEAQKIRCGYSAIQQNQPNYPRYSNCTTTLSNRGRDWITTCTEF